jgi:integrase/recombinase XerD
MSSAAAITVAGDWDTPIGRRKPESHRPVGVVSPSEAPTVEAAIRRWIASQPYAPTTVRKVREQLESRRALGWRAAHGIVTIDQFTAAAAAQYVLYLWDRGAAPATLRKIKNLLMSLARFCADTPGYEGLVGDELKKLRLPKLVERIPEALTEEQCVRLISAAGGSTRNRLIAETFLLTGMRVSELCGLTVESLHLDSRPAYIHVRGSVHDPDRTKNSSERDIVVDYDAHGFGRGYAGRLRTYVAKERPTSQYRDLFLTERREKRTGEPTPLTIVGVQRLMTRLERASDVHCNPHRLRHTFATRCADNDVPMFQLQEALGHKSLDMVRRYYTTSKRAMARGFYRAFGAL